LKAEEGDAVAVGAVVCLIDTEGAKPEGSDKSEGSAEVAPAALLLKRQRQLHQLRLQQPTGCDLCFRDTLSAAEKILDEKKATTRLKEQERRKSY
jgi:2-oxoglutarate dehydrogenase E2 component (dihydrolipoamide succinyltransferase)